MNLWLEHLIDYLLGAASSRRAGCARSARRSATVWTGTTSGIAGSRKVSGGSSDAFRRVWKETARSTSIISVSYPGEIRDVKTVDGWLLKKDERRGIRCGSSRRGGGRSALEEEAETRAETDPDKI